MLFIDYSSAVQTGELFESDLLELGHPFVVGISSCCAFSLRVNNTNCCLYVRLTLPYPLSITHLTSVQVHNRCAYTDKQLIRLQETSDEIPQGETPYTVTLFAFDDLVDSVRPGDRLEVTGVYRAVPTRVNPRIRTVRSIYKTYIDVIHFRRSELAAEDVEDAGEVISNERNGDLESPETSDLDVSMENRMTMALGTVYFFLTSVSYLIYSRHILTLTLTLIILPSQVKL